jgi:hypothetical protein
VNHRIGPPEPYIWYDQNGWWSWWCPVCYDISLWTHDTRSDARIAGQKHLRGPHNCPGEPWYDQNTRPSGGAVGPNPGT